MNHYRNNHFYKNHLKRTSVENCQKNKKTYKMKLILSVSGFILFFVFFIFTFSSKVEASMYVYPMEASLGRNGSSQIRVISRNDSVQFIKVNIKKIVNPGTREEHELQVDNFDTSQLFITPQKIALPAGGERVVRLVSLAPPEKETTWRAYFEGVSEDKLSIFTGEEKKNDSSANIGVNIIWGVLIHVAPKKAIVSLKYRKNTDRIINDGTIRITLRELGICGFGGDCQWVKYNMTIYPDTEISFPGRALSQGKNYRIKYFNWINNKTEEVPLPAMQDR